MHPENVVEGRVGEWMQVSSGGKFFPLDPRPSEIHIDDIANGLALTCRYGGQGDIHRFYSVAEHSLLMAEYALGQVYARDSGNTGVVVLRIAFLALMHDAAEAYVGDLVYPVKQNAGAEFKKMEHNIQRVIMRKYGAEEDADRWDEEVKQLDGRILVNEKAVLFKGPVQAWSTDTYSPLEEIEIHCYDALTVKKRWLHLFHRLYALLKEDR